MTDTTPPVAYTEEELAQARLIVAEEERRIAEAAAAKREAYAVPVRALLQMSEWSAVRDAIQSIAQDNEPDQLFSVHVVALSEIMPRLESVAAMFPAPTNPAS